MKTGEIPTLFPRLSPAANRIQMTSDFSYQYAWRLLRLLTAVAYLMIAIASLVPHEYRPSSGVAPGAVEHFAAYFVLGLLSRLSFKSANAMRLALFNAGFAGCLELLQLFVPGRNAAFLDFFSSSAGSATGILIAAALSARWMAISK
jgi:VanZ family protein